MKVAIPTDDKVNIAHSFEDCIGFMVFETANKEIRLIEFRQNPLKKEENCNQEKKNEILFNLLCDNEVVICHKIDKNLSDMLKASGLKIYKTLETVALKGIINTICH
ncbi:MAG TPA: NifB/NifX family molybdenum-iron cluster-binding protein [Bacteroidota bacterium]|nr:NifB/NifX family molybdenum-iron cluster-binding protein [Bacteroidota bacterium]